MYNGIMKLTIGLGNPGEKYVKNRHNVGRMVVDRLNKKLNIKDQKYRAKIKNDDGWVVLGGALVAKNGNILLAKAAEENFMNESGEWVGKLKNFYKVENKDIAVIYDDLDLEMGRVLVSDKGPKIHNGVNSVIERIGEGFIHVRCGVDDRAGDRSLPGAEYVLRDFPDKEKRERLIERAVGETETLIC